MIIYKHDESFKSDVFKMSLQAMKTAYFLYLTPGKHEILFLCWKNIGVSEITVCCVKDKGYHCILEHTQSPLTLTLLRKRTMLLFLSLRLVLVLVVSWSLCQVVADEDSPTPGASRSDAKLSCIVFSKNRACQLGQVTGKLLYYH